MLAVIEPLLTESAVSLARRIANRELSARAVVDAHIRRIEAVNGVVNALVHDRFDAARAEADAADAQVARGEKLGPLHGVPVTIKECIGIEGLRKTAGLVSRRRMLAEIDGLATTRLRHAGAIPLGVSNVSELMMWMETDNKVYGRTNNPYDLGRTVGGSSGGEGALVAVGGAPIGIGSDIGGSIRLPAFFNGVFGHKASSGLIPNTGHWPMATNDARLYLTTGPLCRRAEDLWPTIQILAGPDGVDGVCTARRLGHPGAVDLGKLVVYDIASSGVFSIDPELVEAQRAVAQHLAELGARVMPFQLAGLRRAFSIWTAMMSAAGDASFSQLLGGGEDLPLGRAFLDAVRGRSPHTWPALGLAALERIQHLLPGQAKALAHGRALKAEVDELLDGDAIILYPSYPDLAPRHGRALLPPLKWQYTAIWNVLEVPVTQVPLGLSKSMLPLGVQVIAGHGRDHVTVAVAQALEKRFGGWVPAA